MNTLLSFFLNLWRYFTGKIRNWEKLRSIDDRLSEIVKGLEHVSKQISEANRVRDAQHSTTIGRMDMIHASTEAKLQELTTTIADELQEIKTIIEQGGDPTEVNARLDAAINAVKAMSDALVPTSELPATGETGTGGSGDGQ